MQIIYPGSHPFIGGITILFLLGLGIIGIILSVIGRKQIKKKQTVLKYIPTIIGSLLVFFTLYNWINYNLIFNSYENQFIGLYKNSKSGHYINLKSDGTWDCNNEKICSSGKWEFIMTEDMHWIEISGRCRKYTSIQISSYGKNYIQFSIDQHSGKKEPYLKYVK
jgi:hypothetical protein